MMENSTLKWTSGFSDGFNETPINERTLCDWCGGEIHTDRYLDIYFAQAYCSSQCRQNGSTRCVERAKGTVRNIPSPSILGRARAFLGSHLFGLSIGIVLAALSFLGYAQPARAETMQVEVVSCDTFEHMTTYSNRRFKNHENDVVVLASIPGCEQHILVFEPVNVVSELLYDNQTIEVVEIRSIAVALTMGGGINLYIPMSNNLRYVLRASNKKTISM